MTTHAPFLLEPATTALVLIDLQKGILDYAKEPHSSTTVLAHAIALADACRRAGITLVRVRVGWSADGGDRLTTPVDAPAPAEPAPADWLDEPDGFASYPGDIDILKHQWGAFYGTALDLQLRRRGIRTLVLAGIATAIGVESTARDAYERGYALVVPEDACGSPSAASHAHSMTVILPRLARVRSTAEVLAALHARR
ncbi:MAG TPA: hydrolase [Burkholderiaceae bacterium]|jgi:nicotinamidase-related amidase|nr:hydrolase [Burkholderiaceae bacterium]